MPASDLLTRATHFFLMAEQVSPLGDRSCQVFRQVSASSVHNPAVHLPALVAAVRDKKHDPDILRELARYPLPYRLSPENLPWYDALVATWKEYYTSNALGWLHAARLALVRLDGCGMPDGMQRPSRLPEWLEEARQIVEMTAWPAVLNGKGYNEYQVLKALAELAAWRPAPGVVTAPETLREWIVFWEQARRSASSLLKGIAAIALLNLPEADLQANSIPPVPTGQCLHDLATAIPEAARNTRCWGYDYLHLLDWQPAGNTSLRTEELAEVARGWLDATRHVNNWCRQIAWQQLTRWDWTGSLNICGVSLLPILVEAVLAEKCSFVLWQMAGCRPVAEASTRTGTGSDFNMLRELEAGWQRHRQYGDWMKTQSGWLGSLRLYQAGLSSEASREAYLSAVAKERDSDILLVLAQWSPGPDAPPAVYREWQQIWQRRLADEYQPHRRVAGLAVLRQALEKGSAGSLRQAALEVWRTGTKEADEVMHLLGAFASRFHEVQTHLAAGSVLDFKDELKLPAPAERQHPRLALPPGHIADRKWGIENEKLRIEN